MPSRRPSVTVIQYSAILILFMTVSAVALLALTALEEIGKPDPPTPIFAPFIPALLALIAGIGLAAILQGLAQVIDALNAAAEPDVSAAISNLTVVMDELRAAMSDQEKGSHPAAAPSPPPLPHAGEARVEPYLARVVELLEELKELSLLDDAEREARREDAAKDEQNIRLDDANQAIEESMRIEQLEQMQRRVEELLNGFNYDEAAIEANRLMQTFPENESVRQLGDRVNRERGAFLEQTAARLFDEVRQEVERRQWRRALDSVQRLLERFPDHPKSERIRQQLRPIQNNAEIEERQEQEQRIQEMINSKRFGDAVELSENLLRRFPDSPQAASLRELIPKLRELATKESNGSGTGMKAFAP